MKNRKLDIIKEVISVLTGQQSSRIYGERGNGYEDRNKKNVLAAMNPSTKTKR